ncbi:MAG TPA: hypothetical protein VEV65_14570 [Kineosporiaceae bacterium]|nr:hypothetical protein [Kineosporiaceae bacterium]
MQTLLAYAFPERETAPGAPGLARVEDHYRRDAGAPLTHKGRDVGGVGLHIWEAASDHRRWLAWQEDRSRSVATVHAPVRYESLVGDLPPDRAAVPLVDALRARPEDVLRLSCPFVLGTVDDSEQLTLFTDAVGLGRLFQLRLGDGWVWSNRPAAVLLFAGMRPRRDARGWRFQAGTDSFMDGTSPFADVTRVTEATRIEVEGRTGRCLVSRLDPLASWLSGSPSDDPLHPDSVAAVAAELQEVARSAGRLWARTPSIGLSGGRDSRVVAAAFLSAGIDVRFHTNDNPPGEADIARELVSRWPAPLEHEIHHPPSSIHVFGPPPIGAIERARRWMRLLDGTQPASYLPRTPPSGHAAVAKLVVSGIGGEIGHGGYHPPDVAKVEALPEEQQLGAYLQRLTSRLVGSGTSAATQEAVRNRTEQVLLRGRAVGSLGVGVVDAFYVLERLPSFTAPTVREDTLVPLMTPGFVRAALRQRPEQRRGADLHRALVARLVPAWRDVPYFEWSPDPSWRPPRRPATPPDAGTPRPPSTWEVDPDRELVAAIIADPEPWADDFDVATIWAAWHRAVAGQATAVEQAALQRVVWQVVFRDYLAELAGEPVPPRTPLPVHEVPSAPEPEPEPATPPPAVASAGATGLRGRLRRRLRRSPTVQRIVRTRTVRRLRGRA